jgi:hypothetical protein
VQDLPPDPGGVLFAAVDQNNDTAFLLRDERDIGRSV